MVKSKKCALSDILNSKDSVVILAGAGISLNPPSNVPTSREFIKGLIECLIPEDFKESVLQLEQIRFEQFIDNIESLFDADLKFLDYFDMITNPNIIHYYVAQMLLKGHGGLTTNFDFLIELALKKLQPDVSKTHIIITQDDFDKYADRDNWVSQGHILLHKLHGSTHNIYTDKDTRESLIATITALGKSGVQDQVFGIEEYKKKAISPLVKNGVLIVVGYSGSDDFDITPLLFELSEIKKIIWIKHNPTKKIKCHELTKNTSIDGSDFMELRQNASTDDLLQNLSNQVKAPIYCIEGDTRKIIKKFWSIHLSDIKVPKLDKFAREDLLSFSRYIRDLYTDVSLSSKYQFAFNLLFEFGDYESAFRVARHGFELAQETNDLEFQSEFLVNLGDLSEVRFEYDEALAHYFNALNNATKSNNDRLIARLFQHIGSIYRHKSNEEQALYYINKALELNKILKNDWGEMNNLDYLGIIAAKNNDWEQAVKCYLDALRLSEKLGALQGKATYLANLGRIYYDQKNFDKALSFYQDALRISELLGNLPEYFQDLDNVGVAFFEKGDWENALPYFQKALIIAERIGEEDPAYIYYDESKTHLLTYIGDCYHKLEDWLHAFNAYNQMLQMDYQLNDEKGLVFDYNKLECLFKSIKEQNENKVIKRIKKEFKHINNLDIREKIVRLWQKDSVV